MFVQLYWGNAYGIQFRVHCQKHNYPFLFDKFRLITKKKTNYFELEIVCSSCETENIL